MTPRDLARRLALRPHPEGGWYRETYRGVQTVRLDRADGPVERSVSTAILYLLEAGQVSALHRIRSTEIWHHYAGGSLDVVQLLDGLAPVVTRLGSDLDAGEVPQAVVPSGVWFGARPGPGADWALVGCTVAPGFDFQDFELGRRDDLLTRFPDCADWIERLSPAG